MAATQALRPTRWVRQPRLPRLGGVTILGVVVLASLAGIAAAFNAALCFISLLIAIIFLVICKEPAAAAYIYISLSPLVVGIDRGGFLALLRPNEALLLALWLLLLLGAAFTKYRRSGERVYIQEIDKYLLAVAFLSSIFSLGSMYVRGQHITSDDLTYALTVWKLLAVYALFRFAIRSPRQATLAVRYLLASGLVVAAIGIGQSIGMQAITSRLTAFSSDLDPLSSVSNSRASSTIGAAIPFADFVAILAVLSWMASTRATDIQRIALRSMTFVFALACLASGQASGALAFFIALTVVGWATQQLWRSWLLAGLIAASALMFLSPVIGARSAQIDPDSGLPDAWTGSNGRLANLTAYVLPRLTEGMNWLFGVRTSARIPAPESWRDWIYIESGYAWLIWVGGLPLLVAFLLFARAAIRGSRRLIRSRDCPELHVVGVGSLAASWLLLLLMTLDPHFTYRGSSDLMMALFAMCASLHEWVNRFPIAGDMVCERHLVRSTSPTSRQRIRLSPDASRVFGTG